MSKERCRLFEDMFNTALIAKPRRKKAKPKPMFPSPEAKAVFLAKRKAEKAAWVAAGAEVRQAYESYIADWRGHTITISESKSPSSRVVVVRRVNPDLSNPKPPMMKFEEWRASK